MSRDESLDSFMKKKESDLQLQRKRQNCVVVVVVAAGVWCVRMVARGGEYLYSCARGRTPLCRRPKRGI
jgi:hypothetical protein